MRISAFIFLFSFLLTAFTGVPVGNEWEKEKEEDYLRMVLSQGQWTLKPLKDGYIEVVHVYLNDPGGQVPAGLYNLFVRERPYRIMLKIQAEVEKGGYGDGLEWVID